ncbi:DEAD/DEAH box helicase [Naumannella halotolerans]|uniref:DEAD/DEAH box helicase n=1 Tax=Naumannella halotolerans TaxID=993414 RepID=UPI00105FDEBE|nr:DEAD/DEAH box helicase [Naumannella halotolerans]
MPSDPVEVTLAQEVEVMLARQLGATVLERGRRYLHEDRVVSLQDSDRLTMAEVAGSGRRPYQVLVGLAEDGSLLHQGCSCPLAGGCPHVAAVALLSAQRQLGQWRHELDALLDERVQHPRLGLQFDPGKGTGAQRRITLTPVQRGRLGNWVRTGIDWADLRHRHQPVAAHPAAPTLNSLRQLLVDTGWYDHAPVVLNGDPVAWRLLGEIAATEVELVWCRQGHVELVEEPLLLGVDLRAEADGGLSLQPGLSTSHGEQVVGADMIGEPPVAVWSTQGERARLHRIERSTDPVTAGLARRGRPLRIPAAEREAFRAKYLPRIRRSNLVGSLDASVPLPADPEPALQLTLTYLGGHRIGLVWGHRYRSAELDLTVGLALDPDDPLARDHDAEAALLRRLQRPDLRLPRTDDGHLAATAELEGLAAADFVTDQLPLLAEAGVEVVVIGDLPEYRRSTDAPVVEVGVGDLGRTDWFSLQVEVRVAGREVPIGLVMQAVGSIQKLVLPDGLVVDTAGEQFDELRSLMLQARRLADPETGELRIGVEQLGLYEQLVALGVVGRQAAAWRRRVERLVQDSPQPPPDPPAGLRASLRPYQKQGYGWLTALMDAGLGGLLADDMGLGKTVQALAAVQQRREAGEQRPVLVVAPTSVVGNWAAEAARFTPDLRVRTIESTLRRQGESLPDLVAVNDLVVTTYSLLRLDSAEYAGIEWSVVLLDEAQTVKNHRSKGYQAVRRLRADSVIAISGTPMENQLMELWALLSICAPGLFDDPEQFAADYQRPIERDHDDQRLAQLRGRIRPFLLRRTKESVAADLPPRIEQVVRVELAPAHQRAYRTRLSRERQRVLGLLDDPQGNRMQIFAALTRLRQLALGPQLIDDGLAGVPSAKIDTLLGRVRELAAEGHRALVFSQFTRFLAQVAERLSAEGIAHAYLDGATKNRAAVIEAFREGEAPVFLISLKAGGVGLNLTEADYCFLLDPWWNPATEEQAIDRTHRIGQQRPVMVYRLISAGTIEERVLALQQSKRDLFTQVIGGRSGSANRLDPDELRSLFTG